MRPYKTFKRRTLFLPVGVLNLGRISMYTLILKLLEERYSSFPTGVHPNKMSY